MHTYRFTNAHGCLTTAYRPTRDEVRGHLQHLTPLAGGDGRVRPVEITCDEDQALILAVYVYRHVFADFDAMVYRGGRLLFFLPNGISGTAEAYEARVRAAVACVWLHGVDEHGPLFHDPATPDTDAAIRGLCGAAETAITEATTLIPRLPETMADNLRTLIEDHLRPAVKAGREAL